MFKTKTTELYDMDSEGWYITIKKTKSDNSEYYTIEKENSDDGRSKTSIQLDEGQFNILIKLIDEMSKVEE